MHFSSHLQKAVLVRRYKRFLADVTLPSGEQCTVHCPNTGSMKNCLFPGHSVWLSHSSNPKRKYPWTWELCETPEQDWIVINTLHANRLVEEALLAGKIKEIGVINSLAREQKVGLENSRIDFVIAEQNTFIEVKSVTLKEADKGYFPDSITSRGQKHLRELQYLAENNKRAILFFCVNHSGIHQVDIAAHIDAAYLKALKSACAAGVEVLCYKTHININELYIEEALPFKLKVD